MSYFGDRLSRIKFAAAAKDLFQWIPNGWKVKIVIWEPKYGEEWTITPVGTSQTKRGSVYVKAEVK